jgi:hypothetical protein
MSADTLVTSAASPTIAAASSTIISRLLTT